MPQERPCMVSYCFRSSIIPQECGSGIWCHYKDIRRQGSCSCSSMSSIMKELLMVSSITKRRHGSRSWSSMSSIMKELLIVSSITKRRHGIPIWSMASVYCFIMTSSNNVETNCWTNTVSTLLLLGNHSLNVLLAHSIAVNTSHRSYGITNLGIQAPHCIR
jgi:hypothetical protein